MDAINAVRLEGRKLTAVEREGAARWIAARQGLPGAYAGTFAGCDDEHRRGVVVFTGERMTSASARHILGEEACRALRLLGVRGREERLRRGVADRRALRGGDGTWRVFPFWYTVLALSEIDAPAAQKELAYAAPALERAARRAPGSTLTAQRRHTVAERALARV